MPEKKIVDTRKVTNVNLDKYDEKLQDMAERSGDRRDLERGSKEKFRNNRNRNNRQQPFSGKRKQDRKSTRLNSSHRHTSRMPSSA